MPDYLVIGCVTLPQPDDNFLQDENSGDILWEVTFLICYMLGLAVLFAIIEFIIELSK